MKRVFAIGIALTLTAAVGCGGPKIVPVSGVVKLNDQPYKDAVVSFQPLGNKDDPNPGRGSVAVTDENGRYSLLYDGERPGALVGKHRVRIFTQLGSEPPPEDGSESPKDVKPQRLAEPIPPEWNEQSQQEFEVPPAGTDKADFNILTKTTPKK